MINLNPSAERMNFTAWNAINASDQKAVENRVRRSRFATSASFIMMACKFINLSILQLVKDGSAVQLSAGQRYSACLLDTPRVYCQ